MTLSKRYIVYVFAQLLLVLQNTVTSAQAITTDFTLQLNNTKSFDSNPMEGRLEIYYNGSWGTVCDDGFTSASARVACASLGFGNIGALVSNRHGKGTGRIWLGKVICTGAELGIDRCAHDSWGTNDCSHNQDVVIRCGNTTDYAVRLINTLAEGTNPMEGRLEIYYYGIWGTVCDDSFFTDASARVACASLGFGYSGRSIGNRHAINTGHIWLDEVTCIGNESGIHKCQYNSWDHHYCGHDKDISIRCGNTPDFSVRLINSVTNDVNTMEGQLEIYYSGIWGAVCDHGFTNTNARVACASLGFGYTGKFIGNRYGTGQGPIWLDDVICNGTERSIVDCMHRPWGSHDCHCGEFVSIKCDETEDYAVRLVNPQNSTRNPVEGRLEVYYAGKWGTVCDDGFNEFAAKVVCASIGYGYEGKYIGDRYGSGTGQMWLDNLNCTGREQSIDKCTHRGWGVHNCYHSEDVSVECGTAENSRIRLVNSLSHISNPKEGRLEIYYSGSWGTVCDDGFTDASASVACASLGFRHIGTFIGNRHGKGTGQIWLKDVACTGTEQGIDKCTNSPSGVHDCTHDKDVSISCGMTARLVNSLYAANNPKEGRLEIYYGGVWKTVCSDGFTDVNAKVACASLGFGHTGTIISNRHGNGTGEISMDDYMCNGTEQSIDMCSRSSLGVHDCGHLKDVSIRCGDTQDFTVRLINPLSSNSKKERSEIAKEGRLEIYYSGIWGTVCDDNFTDVSAKVACASLGFRNVGKVIGHRHGGGTDAIWLDDVKCNGTERSIEQCSHRGWGVHNCNHGKDVSISCDSAGNGEDNSNNDNIPDCGNTLYSGLREKISSPSFAQLYLKRPNCTYFITVPSGHKAVINFSELNIDPTDDWVKVSCVDGEAFHSPSFSGSILPSILTITSCNSIRIQFYANFLWDGKGFKLSYEITPDQNPNPSSNVLVISVLACLLGLCILFVVTLIIRTTRKTRQEIDRVLHGVQHRPVACSGQYEIEAKTGETRYEDLRLSGTDSANDYQTIDDYCQSL